MNHWSAGIAALLAIAVVGCSSSTVISPDQSITVPDQGTITAPEQGQVTDPAPALADGSSLSIASLNLPTATVVSVGDGDTLRMDYQGENVTVRLACIDAPETSQTPWGPASTERLRQLTPRGSTIQFRHADTDRYGRMVAEVYAGGQNMNLQMVSEGHAVVYQQFLRSCPETQDLLLQAEAQARQQRLNFWSQSNPVMPWDYRRGDRSSAPAEPTAELPKDGAIALADTKDLTPSRAAVKGSCECPYDVDSAGRSCGGRSTHSRSGGERGGCYVN